MLTHWKLDNFKAIRGPLDLPLKGVTILAGLNSSGKSSVLQSILLVSQTLANRILDRPLILNGNSVQLGTFRSLRTTGAGEVPIRIGFEYVPASEQYRAKPRTGSRRSNMDVANNIKSIEALATFAVGRAPQEASLGIEALTVSLTDTTLSVTNLSRRPRSARLPRFREELHGTLGGDNVLPARVTARIRLLSESDKIGFLDGIGEPYSRFIPDPEGAIYFAELYVGDVRIRGNEVLLARLNHFLPNRFMRKFIVRERLLQETTDVVDTLLGFDPSYRLDITDQYSTSPLSPPEGGAQIPSVYFKEFMNYKIDSILLSGIGEIIGKLPSLEPFLGDTIFDLLKWARNATVDGQERVRFIDTVRNLVFSYLTNNFLTEEEVELGIDILSGDIGIEVIESAEQKITSFFTAMIRYLGPLRADPQAAKGFAPSSEPDDVGPMGQYAPAVYDAYRRRPIQWWNPVTGQEERGTLEKAVGDWARYLGVAHQVTTAEAGISGVSWTIQRRPGDEHRPLSAVGFGVSQVLPILVAGLLAPVGSLMLIEQPELHLHPRAQARLGDFFLALSALGKQCIIETHSDCLVNQLRYRMVKDGPTAIDAIAMYFVEQDEKGDAQFVPVEISAGGNIVNWPDGFFDEGLNLEDRITSAAIQARDGHNRDA